MTESIKKAVIYVRSATDRPGVSESLAVQEKYCRALAESSGYLVTKVFKDEGKSGLSLDRPGLKALFNALLTASEPNTVFVTNRDRLIRDYSQWPLILDRFAKLKAELIVAKEGATPLPPELTPIDRFVLARLSWIEEAGKV